MVFRVSLIARSNFAVLLVSTLCLSGCVTKSKTETKSGGMRSPDWGSKSTSGKKSANTPSVDSMFEKNPRGYTQSMMMRAALLPLGSVPYDRFLLPLISPDGQYVATQTGDSPGWNTTLAASDAQPPSGTVIEIYRMDRRESIAPNERIAPERIASVKMPVVMGRSCDMEGFLVESPQADGARWIGKALWDTGEIRWLVQGEDVNAFAALAPDGRLAWSHRAIDGAHFDLCVRDATLQEWTVDGDGGDWLMPVWSTFGDGLYALHRQDGRLQVCYGNATGPAAFRSAQHAFTLLANADRDPYAAYQAVVAQGDSDGCLTGGQPMALLFHPRLSRMMVWRPLSAENSAAIQLNGGSIAALQENPDAVVVCKEGELILQSLKQPDANILLTKGTWVPRRTPRWDWRYVLLSPGDEGQVQIMAMRLMPREQAAPAASASR